MGPRRKPRLAGISEVLKKSQGVVVMMFSKHVGTLKSNEVEALAVL